MAFWKPRRVSVEFFVITFQGIKTCEHRFSSCSVFKVDQLVFAHLSVQKSRPDPMGGLHCCWCWNKTWTSSLGESDTLTIVKNKLEIRKLQPPKIKRVKNSKKKKKTTKHYKGQFLNVQKNSLYVTMLLLEFKNDL